MATDTQIQIIREDPDIEAYRLGLIKAAKVLADQPITLPGQQVAGLTSMQQEALRRGQAQAASGIGAYAPYMTQASGALTAAQQALDPSSLYTYMNPYQQSVQNEIARSYQIQAQQAGLGAVGQPGGPSAYGGSRAAVQQGEIGRNMAQAMAQAQAAAFENAQRQQLAQGEALGRVGLQQASLGEMAQGLGQKETSYLFDLGKQFQAQDQATLEAQRQSNMAQLYEPYQRLGFLSDIYKGAPTTQQTLTSATSPNVSPAQSILGMGIAGLSAYAGVQRAGLF